MKLRADQVRLELAAHTAIAIDEARDATLTCLLGTLWMTLDRDVRDIVLQAGESFRVDRPGAVVVSCTVDSALLFESPALMTGAPRRHARRDDRTPSTGLARTDLTAA